MELGQVLVEGLNILDGILQLEGDFDVFFLALVVETVNGAEFLVEVGLLVIDVLQSVDLLHIGVQGGRQLVENLGCLCELLFQSLGFLLHGLGYIQSDGVYDRLRHLGELLLQGVGLDQDGAYLGVSGWNGLDLLVEDLHLSPGVAVESHLLGNGAVFTTLSPVTAEIMHLLEWSIAVYCFLALSNIFPKSNLNIGMVLVIGSIHIDYLLHVLENGPGVHGRLPKEEVVHVMQHKLQRLILYRTLHLLKHFLESQEMLVHGWIRIELSIQEANRNLELCFASRLAEDVMEALLRVEEEFYDLGTPVSEDQE